MVGLRKLKWVLHSVVNKIFLMVFDKDPLLVPCYLILIFVICFTSDIENYADDTNTYECDQHCDNLISNMELTAAKIFNWFEFNNLKTKCFKMPFFFITLSTHFDKH